MIDRRYAVLGVSIAATIGTSPAEGPDTHPIFVGFEQLTAGPFTFDAANPSRVWQITLQVVLPPEAEHSDFGSTLVVQARFVDDAKHEPVTYRLTDCNENALGVSSVEYQTWIDIDGPFADCLPETACAPIFCLEIETTDDESPVDVEWDASASVMATDTVAVIEDVIHVPIDITIEEIEP